MVRVGDSSHFLDHLFAEHLGGGLPSKAFAGRVVEAIADHLDVVISKLPDVALAWQLSAYPEICVFHGTLLPR